MKNALLAVAIVASVVIGIMVLSWFNRVMEITAQEDRQEQIYQEKVQTQLLIEECMQQAYDRYVSDWDKQCSIEGLPNDCLLSNFQAEQFDAQLQKAEELCVTRFK